MGYKFLTIDNRGLFEDFQYKIGEWNEVPGNGCEVAETDGLFFTGAHANKFSFGHTLVEIRGEELTGAPAPRGAVCYRRVFVTVVPPGQIVRIGWAEITNLEGGGYRLRGFHKNGQPTGEAHIFDTRLEGTCRFWDSSGELWEEKLFYKGHEVARKLGGKHGIYTLLA